MRDRTYLAMVYYAISTVSTIGALGLVKLNAYFVHFFDMATYPIFIWLAYVLIIIGFLTLFLGISLFIKKDGKP